MKTVFVSYDHDDQQSKRDMDSIRINSNNDLFFYDESLKNPILNDYGHINRRLPSDPAAKPVCNSIIEKLQKSSRLLVLVGRNTHSSEWVKWEVNTFRDMKSKPRILFMRVRGDCYSGFPSSFCYEEVYDWDLNYLIGWLEKE